MIPCGIQPPVLLSSIRALVCNVVVDLLGWKEEEKVKWDAIMWVPSSLGRMKIWIFLIACKLVLTGEGGLVLFIHMRDHTFCSGDGGGGHEWSILFIGRWDIHVLQAIKVPVNGKRTSFTCSLSIFNLNTKCSLVIGAIFLAPIPCTAQ